MTVDRYTGCPARTSDEVLLYPGPKVVVTTICVHTPRVRYPVARLTQISRIEVRGYPALVGAVGVGAVELMIAVPFAVAYGSGLLACAGVLLAIGIGLGALVDSRRNPRLMVLSAVYRGRRVELFSTRDKAEFGRVRLAVIRAVEASRDHLPGR